jgi:hypothetical protein
MKRAFLDDFIYHSALAYQDFEPDGLQGRASRGCLERVGESLLLSVVVVFPFSILNLNKLTEVVFILLAWQISDRFHG